MLRALSLCTCCRQYPGAATGRRLRSSHPAVSAFPEIAVGSACTSTFSRLARRSLALRPAHSRRHLYVTCYTEGFSHFVTSMTAPVASGWSVRRAGLSPTGKRRLLTAHANSGHCATAYEQVEPTRADTRHLRRMLSRHRTSDTERRNESQRVRIQPQCDRRIRRSASYRLRSGDSGESDGQRRRAAGQPIAGAAVTLYAAATGPDAIGAGASRRRRCLS